MTVGGRVRDRRRSPQAADPEGRRALVSSWVSDMAVMRYTDGESSWAEGLMIGAAMSVSAELRRRVTVWRSFSADLQAVPPRMWTSR